MYAKQEISGQGHAYVRAVLLCAHTKRNLFFPAAIALLQLTAKIYPTSVFNFFLKCVKPGVKSF